MEKQFSKNKKIQLVFERSRQQDMHLSETKTKYSDNNFFNMFSVDTDEISNWFGKFKISELEFTIITVVNTQDFAKLFIGKNTDQGLRVVLRPNENTFSNESIEPINSETYEQRPLNTTKI